jgi:hypothetical protein
MDILYHPNGSFVIAQLPDSIHDVIAPGSEKAKIITHCRCELMQQVWHLMLDDEFVAAYEHGFVSDGVNGTPRRFYPRIFTYSADYPEK